MATQGPRAVEAGDTLDTLVDQFSDQYAFLRELIQNSIDAGSAQVWVSFEFKPSSDGKGGIAILHIDDTGEGMTREIIDTQLTRLFSSSKESDMTKIGKFGIGFVSIFALNPNAVIVDTGRGGENWRIMWNLSKHSRNQFDRIILNRPVDGTQIQFIKEMSNEEYAKFRDRSLKTIIHWCKHAEAEVYVDNDLINQPFQLAHPLVSMHEVPGTVISLAPTTESEPFYGFYNRGLTLYEGKEAVIPGITFKIQSRYLEHTLTRDNVIKDENYKKAIAILQEAVDKSLRPHLFDLAANPGKVPAGVTQDEVFGYLSLRLNKLPESLLATPVIPTLNGTNLSIKELLAEAKKNGELFYDDQKNEISRHFCSERPVIRWQGPDKEPGLGRMLKAALPKITILHLNSAYVQPVVQTNLAESDQRLLQAAFQLLVEAGSPHKKLVPGNFNYPGSGHSDRLYITQNEAGELQRAAKVEGLRGLFGYLFGKKPHTLVVNMQHPLIEPHFRLRQKFPALSAYLLAKALTLDDGLDAETNQKMIKAALDQEQQLVQKLA